MLTHRLLGARLVSVRLGDQSQVQRDRVERRVVVPGTQRVAGDKKDESTDYDVVRVIINSWKSRSRKRRSGVSEAGVGGFVDPTGAMGGFVDPTRCFTFRDREPGLGVSEGHIDGNVNQSVTFTWALLGGGTVSRGRSQEVQPHHVSA